MIFGGFADLHSTEYTPKCRKDNYPETLKNKFLQILDIFDLEGCNFALHGGDFWDSSKQPLKLLNWYLKVFKDKWAHFPIYGVYGQHDSVNHTSDLSNTPYLSLVNAGFVNHLSNTSPKIITDTSDGGTDVHIYGASWGESIPKIQNKNVFNILVIHETFVMEKIWEGQKDVKFANDFIKQHNFDFVLCGDNHTPFKTHYRSRQLLMCGSVGRITVGQKDHTPCVYTFDTSTRKLKTIPLKIEKDVIKFEEHEEKKKHKLDLEKFVSLLDKKTISRDFVKSTLQEAKSIKNSAIRKEIVDIIENVTK